MLQAYQGGFAARATSSDLAAAQALAELRHEDEGDTDSMESGEEEREEEECRDGSSSAGYDRGFRVTAPPLPLWVPGIPSVLATANHPFIHQDSHSSTRLIMHPVTLPSFHPIVHPPIHPFHLSVHVFTHPSILSDRS